MRHYQTDDLILHRLRQTVLPFTWGSAVATARLTASQETYFDEAREHGLTAFPNSANAGVLREGTTRQQLSSPPTGGDRP